MRIRGEQYPTSQHGFARDNTFRCISDKADQGSFLFASNEETRKVYPFDFELIITYVLDNNTLKVTWEVRNTGEETMYFTIGGHPAFCFAGEKETKEDYLLYFPGRKTLDYILIDPGEAAADPSVVYELELDQGYCPVNEEMFARDALIFDGGQFEEVWLCRKDRTPYVGIRCKDFPNFGIWSVKDAPFVCLEPWMGRCDDVGFDRELSEKPNVNKAEPGDRFEQSYVIIAG